MNFGAARLMPSPRASRRRLGSKTNELGICYLQEQGCIAWWVSKRCTSDIHERAINQGIQRVISPLRCSSRSKTAATMFILEHPTKWKAWWQRKENVCFWGWNYFLWSFLSVKIAICNRICLNNSSFDNKNDGSLQVENQLAAPSSPCLSTATHDSGLNSHESTRSAWVESTVWDGVWWVTFLALKNMR